MDPVIGRDAEIRRVIQILSRKTKNNPVLIGEPGVGKTAIVEGPRAADRARRRSGRTARPDDLRPRHGLARRRREVPRRVRGAPARRCSRRSRPPRARSSCSSTSCTPSSAPARPKARWTPATCSSRCSRAASCTASARPPSTSTASTSRRTRRSSAASSRSWSMSRPSRTRSRSCAACASASRCTTASGSRTPRSWRRPTLSHRYITDRFLPDKAIDLVDEACAVVRTEIDSMPQELDEITRRVMQLEIEEAALNKENGRGEQGAPGGAAPGARGPAGAGRRDDARSGRPSARRSGGCRRLREEIEQTRQEIEEAERAYDLNRAAELRHGRLPELERQLGERGGAPRARSRARARLLREEVTEDEIAEVVARWTGIPVARLLEGEREKLLRLDEVLHERVIGQDEAVAARRRRGDPRARRHQGPAPADRLVPVPRAHRRGQDRAREARSPRRCSTPRTT